MITSPISSSGRPAINFDEGTVNVIDFAELNDPNNYPFSSGRCPGVAPDDNEVILVTLPEALKLAE